MMQPACSQFTWSATNFVINSPPKPAETSRADKKACLSRPHISSAGTSSTPTSSDKENVPLANVPPPALPDDSSAPVKRFLGSLNPSLERLLPIFHKLGIEDFETLHAFKTWSPDEREELLRDDLNKFQLLAVQNFLRRAN
jgi:hypothetical protein